jgi:hypothetical protein
MRGCMSPMWRGCRWRWVVRGGGRRGSSGQGSRRTHGLSDGPAPDWPLRRLRSCHTLQIFKNSNWNIFKVLKFITTGYWQLQFSCESLYNSATDFPIQLLELKKVSIYCLEQIPIKPPAETKSDFVYALSMHLLIKIRCRLLVHLCKLAMADKN